MKRFLGLILSLMAYSGLQSMTVDDYKDAFTGNEGVLYGTLQTNSDDQNLVVIEGLLSQMGISSYNQLLTESFADKQVLLQSGLASIASMPPSPSSLSPVDLSLSVSSDSIDLAGGSAIDTSTGAASGSSVSPEPIVLISPASGSIDQDNLVELEEALSRGSVEYQTLLVNNLQTKQRLYRGEIDSSSLMTSAAPVPVVHTPVAPVHVTPTPAAPVAPAPVVSTPVAPVTTSSAGASSSGGPNAQVILEKLGSSITDEQKAAMLTHPDADLAPFVDMFNIGKSNMAVKMSLSSRQFFNPAAAPAGAGGPGLAPASATNAKAETLINSLSDFVTDGTQKAAIRALDDQNLEIYSKMLRLGSAKGAIFNKMTQNGVFASASPAPAAPAPAVPSSAAPVGIPATAAQIDDAIALAAPGSVAKEMLNYLKGTSITPTEAALLATKPDSDLDPIYKRKDAIPMLQLNAAGMIKELRKKILKPVSTAPASVVSPIAPVAPIAPAAPMTMLEEMQERQRARQAKGPNLLIDASGNLIQQPNAAPSVATSNSSQSIPAGSILNDSEVKAAYDSADQKNQDVIKYLQNILNKAQALKLASVSPDSLIPIMPQITGSFRQLPERVMLALRQRDLLNTTVTSSAVSSDQTSLSKNVRDFIKYIEDEDTDLQITLETKEKAALNLLEDSVIAQLMAQAESVDSSEQSEINDFAKKIRAAIKPKLDSMPSATTSGQGLGVAAPFTPASLTPVVAPSATASSATTATPIPALLPPPPAMPRPGTVATTSVSASAAISTVGSTDLMTTDAAVAAAATKFNLGQVQKSRLANPTEQKMDVFDKNWSAANSFEKALVYVLIKTGRAKYEDFAVKGEASTAKFINWKQAVGLGS